MDSYKYKNWQWVACHECELNGANLDMCTIGHRISDKESNFFKYGCWAGILMEKFENEEDDNKIHN